VSDRLRVVRIAGDGVGPELVAAGTRVVEALGVPVEWVDAEAGYGTYLARGVTAPAETVAAVRCCGAAVKGPFRTPNGGTVRSANHYLRHGLDLYACLRPIPLRPGRPLLLVREQVEDLYGAIEWMATPDVAQAVKVASRQGCRRIARFAFAVARRYDRRRVTLVHKANNLKLTEGMFLEVAGEVAAEHPDIHFDEMLADTAASTMVLDPGRFDVLLTSHTIGDVLGNLGAALAGSLGLVGSINSGAGVHVAEAGHGDAAELAGLDRVNPIAFLGGIALLLDALGRSDEGAELDAELRLAAESGPRTLDLGGGAGTGAVVDHLCARLARRRSPTAPAGDDVPRAGSVSGSAAGPSDVAGSPGAAGSRDAGGSAEADEGALRLDRPSLLGPALQAAARRAGHRLRIAPAPAPDAAPRSPAPQPVAAHSLNGHAPAAETRSSGADGPGPVATGLLQGPAGTVPVPADADLPWAVAGGLLERLAASWSPAAGAVDCVALAPAAGVCGPAAAGPVDAVRDLGCRQLPAGPLRVLVTPQTRCWMLACTLRADQDARCELAELPPGAATDTARLTEFQHDRGLGAYWPELLLLGPPQRLSDGALRVLVAATDAGYADGLVAAATGRAGAP
jgi:isocitrate dehydrogenase (NAD+)